MLYLFDLDGTLISSYMNNSDKAYNVWEVLPGRREKLTRLVLQGDEIAVVTNQGGVAWGFVTLVEMWAKINAALTACGLNIGTTRVYVCYHDEHGTVFNDPIPARRRKPSPAMLREAIEHHPDAARLGVLMVGDRTEDLEAARDAGVPFQWAHVFFGA